MPNTAPFAALRYNLEHIGSLSDVIAPPYDVIDPDFQDELYKRHPANCIRVILNRVEPGDSGDERYERAAGFVLELTLEFFDLVLYLLMFEFGLFEVFISVVFLHFYVFFPLEFGE